MKHYHLFIFLLVVLTFGFGNEQIKNSIDSGKEVVLRLEQGKENPRNSEGDFIQLKENLPTNVYEKFIGTVNQRKTLLPEIAEYNIRIPLPKKTIAIIIKNIK